MIAPAVAGRGGSRIAPTYPDENTPKRCKPRLIPNYSDGLDFQHHSFP